MDVWQSIALTDAGHLYRHRITGEEVVKPYVAKDAKTGVSLMASRQKVYSNLTVRQANTLRALADGCRTIQECGEYLLIPREDRRHLFYPLRRMVQVGYVVNPEKGIYRLTRRGAAIARGLDHAD